MTKAFTLIELLVVVLIIGILSAIALPQYKKAVIKARFAEAIINLKAIGEAQQVCALEKDSYCYFDEMAITLPGGNSWEVLTENFVYYPIAGMGDGVLGTAWYRKEDVCICYLQTGELVVNQDGGGGCAPSSPSYDYSKLLNLREVPYDECGCC